MAAAVFLSFDEWLSRQDEAALNCRMQRHQWPNYDDKRVLYARSRRTGVISMEQECMRGCGVWRVKYSGPDAPATHLIYPQGYQWRTPEREAGMHVTTDRKAAIEDTLLSLIPPERFKEID